MKQISVRPIQANLTRDTQTIGKMDPYCVCIIGTEKQQTKHHNESGKNPKWNDQLLFFNNQAITKMTVQVYDKDLASSDIVGQGQVDISQVMFGNGQSRNETVNLQHNGKPSGQVLLTLGVKYPQGGFCQGGVCYPPGHFPN